MKGKKTKNIVLITLDCVRPDHLGCFGYAGVDTPTINHLAEKGILFEQAICSAPNTWVSHASIFTGCNPLKHGLHTPYDKLGEDTPTIAEILSQNGYYTLGFPAHNLVGKVANFHRGFDVFYEDSLKFDSKIEGMKWCSDWTKVLTIADEQIKRNKHKPLFIWFHYINTHHLPNNSILLPDSYKHRFGSKWQYYDAKISYADKSCVKNIVDILEKNQIRENTVLVIFSDHGEELEKGSCPKHDNSLFEDVLRILLLIVDPANQTNRKVSDLVRSIDILPTILDMLHIPQTNTYIDGESLVPLFICNDAVTKGWAYSENIVKGLLSIRTPTWKLIIHVEKSDENNEIKVRPKRFQLFKVAGSSFSKDMSVGEIPREQVASKVEPILRCLEESLNSKRSIVDNEKDRLCNALKSLGYI